MPNKPHTALLIVAHGSSHDAAASETTRAHADEIRLRGVFGEVACAFFKEEPRLRDALGLVKSEDVYVVPNCISEGWFTRQIIPREMALDGPLTVCGARTIKYCEPVGSHARMTDVLLHRAAEVLKNFPREETSLLIVGHGTDRDLNSSTAVEKQVALLRSRSEFAEVAGAFIDQAPLVSDWEKWTTKSRVVVVPFFIADGPHVRGDIPSLLGIEGDPFSRAHRVRGREIFYTHTPLARSR